MTEEISQVYENVDIRAWAKQIRENKIREFQEVIDLKKKEGMEYTEIEMGGFTLTQAIEHLSKGFVIAVDLCRMELKLDMLKKSMKNFFKDNNERLLWIRLNAERLQYAGKILNQQDLELGNFGEPFSLMQISENQLVFDEEKRDAPRYSFEELLLPEKELFSFTKRKSKEKFVEMFGTELGKIADELL